MISRHCVFGSIVQKNIWTFIVSGTFCAGCYISLVRRSGLLRSPSFSNGVNVVYPPDINCSYTITAPQDARRNFLVNFGNFNLSDARDAVKVWFMTYYSNV